MTSDVRPRQVRRRADEQLVTISWSDDHESTYEYAYLRGWCPCAGCQGHSGTVLFRPAGSPTLDRIGVVGNYALLLEWGDGHQTGIYAYRRLRDLCPCPQCGGPKQ